MEYKSCYNCKHNDFGSFNKQCSVCDLSLSSWETNGDNFEDLVEDYEALKSNYQKDQKLIEELRIENKKLREEIVNK